MQFHARRYAGLLITIVGVFCAAPASADKSPTGSQTVSYGYFDPRYPAGDPPELKRQHLGRDFPAPAGSVVVSPIDGRIIADETRQPDVMQAYLVIRDDHGVEHVLGHISTNLSVGTAVRAGKPVGTVRNWPGNSHVHWGINKLGVAQAKNGLWGWGRAPFTATRAEAARRGWVEKSSDQLP